MQRKTKKRRPANRKTNPHKPYTRLLFFFLFLAITSTILYSETLQEAKTLEQQENIEEAIGLYTLWLQENSTHSDFESVLTHTLSLIPDSREQIDFIDSLLHTITAKEPRYFLTSYLAELEEHLGLLEKAQKHYELAAFILPDSKDYTSLYRSASLLFEFGFYNRARAQLRTIITTCSQKSMVLTARLLLARTLYYENSIDESKDLVKNVYAEQEVQNFTPKQLYMLNSLADSLGLRSLQEETSDLLRKRFPQSPEHYLVRSTDASRPEVVEHHSPQLFFHPHTTEPANSGDGTPPEKTLQHETLQEETPVIQTGSFLKREHAESMVKELQGEGFEADVLRRKINDKTYFKVIIPADEIDEVQQYLLELKEKGYEAFLLFD
jgi:hypothetical protein